jgi:hypothetical protein
MNPVTNDIESPGWPASRPRYAVVATRLNPGGRSFFLGTAVELQEGLCNLSP